MSGDDHFIKPDNDVSDTDIAHALRKLYRTQPLIEQAADSIERLKTNVRHWREECGKLHAQIAALKWKSEVQNDQVTVSLDHYTALVRDHQKLTESEHAMDGILQAHQMEVKVLYEALERALSHFSFMSGEQAARAAIEIEDVLSQHPRSTDDGTCVRCGAAPRNASGLCATCVDEDAVKAGEIDIEECGNHSAGSPP